MRILKRGVTVTHAQPPAVVDVPATEPAPFEPAGPPPPASVPTAYYAPPRPVISAPPPVTAPRRLPYSNRPPVPIPAPDAVVAPVPITEAPVIAPAATALPVITPALRLQHSATSAWERIERIDRYRLARGLKLRLRLAVTVCDTERHTYANWPGATATIEIGEPGQPGIENGKDAVWAIDELVEAIGRVGPEKVARVLRELRPPAVELVPGVPVIGNGEGRSA